jgi:DNA-binding NarL/FixJ family response regulator
MIKKIVIADDHKIFCQGLRTLFEQKLGATVVAESGDGILTVELCKRYRPDMVIMDITMPRLNGIEATRQIKSSVPNATVIMLSMHSDIRFIVESLRAGASGYLLKESAFEELALAIKTIESKKIYLSSEIADTIIKDYVFQRLRSESAAFSILTAREREVLQLIAEGKTTKEIAAQYDLSIKTIESHRQQIMEKLNLHSIAQLTKFAIREGITGL